jgi:opacity protein-like surface antigen
MLKKTLITTAILAATTQFAFANGGTYVPEVEKGAQLNTGYYIGAGADLNYGNKINSGSGNWGRPITAELFGGYGINWTNFISTSFELFGTVGGNKNYTYGARFLPGIMIYKDLMAFGNIGYVRGNLYPNPSEFNSNKVANGIQFGAGLQTKVFDNVSLRGGWNRNYFSAYGVHPKVDQYYLSAIYHFTV